MTAAAAAASVHAAFAEEEDLCNIRFDVNHIYTKWNPDGTWSENEYYEIPVDRSWVSAWAETEEDVQSAKDLDFTLAMSWDTDYVYTYIAYENAKCVFTITEENRPVTGISLDITSYSLEVGDTFSLTETILPENATNQKVIWSSNNPSVAVVSSIGNVTAMSVGTTTITATTEDGGYTADCIVTVTNKTPIHGDVNGDGRIDYYDVTALYAAYVSDSFDLDTMDINKDGIVDYYDIARLYAYYRGYIFDL